MAIINECKFSEEIKIGIIKASLDVEKNLDKKELSKYRPGEILHCSHEDFKGIVTILSSGGSTYYVEQNSFWGTMEEEYLSRDEILDLLYN